MSAESIQSIADAIAAHLRESNPDAVLTDWFIAYGSMQHAPDAPGGISHGIHYSTSDGSPQGALGIATLGIESLHDDLAKPDGD